jgi:hypothetical protein
MTKSKETRLVNLSAKQNEIPLNVLETKQFKTLTAEKAQELECKSKKAAPLLSGPAAPLNEAITKNPRC